METLTVTPAETVEEATISVSPKVIETLTVTPVEDSEEVILVETNRYAAGKIYKLVCTTGHFYIGSTITALNYRLNNHKQSSKKDIERPVYKYINTVGWDNVSIELIEKYSCKSKEELLKKEDEYIVKEKRNKLCLNFNRACITPEEHAKHIKEYYKKNKEKIIENHKKYIAENKEKVDEYRKKYREKNAEAIADYNKKYVAEHVETVKEAKKDLYERKKDSILAVNRLYVESHKEAVNAYKLKWANENYAKLAPAKKEAHDAKTAARVLRDSTSVTCTCGGTYLPRHKDRHMESKKHAAFAAVPSIV